MNLQLPTHLMLEHEDRNRRHAQGRSARVHVPRGQRIAEDLKALAARVEGRHDTHPNVTGRHTPSAIH